MTGKRGSSGRGRGGVGTRGGVARVAAMAIGLAVVLLALATGEARAGLYRVVQCGWGVGAELDPSRSATEGTAFTLNSYTCTLPPGQAGMRFEGAFALDGMTGLARARWIAPAGTSFTAADLIWSGSPQPGNWQGIGVDTGNEYRVLASAFTAIAPTPLDLRIDGSAWGFEAFLQCLTGGAVFGCTRSVPSTMWLRDLTFTLKDGQAPEVKLGGTAVAGGWQRGTVALAIDAADVGSGVAGEVAWLDGTMILAAPIDCALQAVEGELRGTKMQPCPSTASRTVEVDTTRLADGPHRLRGCATDFSTGQGCAPDAELEVDNSPPSISFSDAAGGEVAATESDRWSGPAAGTISMRRADSATWTDLPTTLDAEGEGTATLSARLPDLSAGTWFLRASAADAAGNGASTELRIAGTPAELRRQAADGHGEKGADSHGGRGPAPRRGATRLEVRLVTSSDDRHPSARPLLVAARAPWNDAAAILGAAHAPADRRDRGPRGPRTPAGLSVDYGTAAAIRGRLTDARGQGVAGRWVSVAVQAAAGVLAPARRVTTDAGGRFTLRLPPGPSRRVTVAFHGGGGFAPARPRSLALRVRAGVSLAAEPPELQTGESVRLRGRVLLGPAHLSRRGKLVAIQYLERATKRWRPALVVRTDAKGRFDTSYRFRYLTEDARIRLRATAPAEGGWPFARGSSPPVTVTVRGRLLAARSGR